MPVITNQSRQMFHRGGELFYFFDRLGQASYSKRASFSPPLHNAVCPPGYCPATTGASRIGFASPSRVGEEVFIVSSTTIAFAPGLSHAPGI